MSLVYAFEDQPGHQTIIVMGDDSLVHSTEDFDLEVVTERIASLGIVPESLKLHSWSQVSFISGIWAPLLAGGYYFIPKPGRLLAGLFATANDPGKATFDWARQVAEAFEPTFRGCMGISRWLQLHCKHRGGRSYAATRKDRMKWDFFTKEEAPIDWHTFINARYGHCGATDWRKLEPKRAHVMAYLSVGGLIVLNNDVANKVIEFDIGDSRRELIAIY
jgi:hypothetical protein